MEPAEVLQVTGLDKRFGGVHALRGADFALRRGEVHALLGANGAGKSTFIKALSGVFPPDAGEIVVDGRRASITSVKQAQQLGIQTIHQELELALPLSIAENVFMGRLPCRNGAVDWDRLHHDTRSVLARMGTSLDPRTRVADLSVSDRQVVEIARTLARDGSIVIMDEPTAALPPHEVGRLFETIRAIVRTGVSVIYVSHRLDEVLEIADRVTVFREGRRVATVPKAGLSKADIIHHMLGGAVVDIRDERRTRPAADGPLLLSVRGLASGNALQGLDIDVAPGEIVGLFGLLGAGQSVVTEVLFGVREARASQFGFSGHRTLPTGPSQALAWGMGFVPADRKVAGLALKMSVQENLFLASLRSVSRFGVLKRSAMAERARRMAEAFRIKCSSPEQTTGQLSGGNQQKVAIAKWHARPTSFLMLDEPTRGVDVGARVEIYRFLQDFAGQGGACLVSSTDAAELAGLCDRVLVLKNGRLSLELFGESLSEPALMTAAM